MKGFIPLAVFAFAISSSISIAATYDIHQVESWNSLNLRAFPSSKSRVIAEIPASAKGLVSSEKQVKKGSTYWKEVIWKDQKGWVSERFLKRVSDEGNPSTLVEKTTSSSSVEKETKDTILKKKQKGMWVLECGAASPYWRVEVLPEWMLLTQGNKKSGVPIQHQYQKHGKWHKVALLTELRGQQGASKVSLDIRYDTSCVSSLKKKRVSFRVEGSLNEDDIRGCCYAYQY